MQKRIFKLIPWLISFFVIFVIAFQLVKPMRINQGMWFVFDDVHTVRTNEMVRELKTGQFPVRYLSDLAFKRGYLLFNFYSPLVYYLSSILVFLGKSPLNAVKNTFQLSYLVAGIGMFLLLKNTFPKKWLIPLIGSFLLISSPYFNYNAYFRGALGELWGFALIPWVFLAYEALKKYKSNFFIIFFASITSLLVYTHAISAFIVVPFLAIKFLLEYRFTKQINKETVKKYFYSAFIGIFLSSSYLLPMIFEKSQVKYSEVDFVTNGFKNGFIKPLELFGLAVNSDPKIVPITLGKVISGILLVAIIFVFYKIFISKVKIKLKSELIFILTLIISNIFILTHYSSFIWEKSSILQMTQFPYRFMILLTFLSTYFISISLGLIKNRFLTIIFSIIIISITLLNNQIFYKPTGYYFASSFEAADTCATTTWQAEYLPKWTELCATNNSPKQEVRAFGETQLNESIFNPNNREITIKTNAKSGYLIVDRYFYPGWQATTNDKKLTIEPEKESGLIKINLTPEDSEIKLEFKDTTVRKLGNLTTLLTIGLIISYSLFKLLKKIIYLKNK